MPHERLQNFVIVDYTKHTTILAVKKDSEKEIVIGIGEYNIEESSRTGNIAFAVRDDFQSKGVGTELLSYLILLAKKEGLLGFTAEVLVDNTPMLHLFEKMSFDTQKRTIEGVCELKLAFRSPVE